MGRRLREATCQSSFLLGGARQRLSVSLCLFVYRIGTGQNINAKHSHFTWPTYRMSARGASTQETEAKPGTDTGAGIRSLIPRRPLPANQGPAFLIFTHPSYYWAPIGERRHLCLFYAFPDMLCVIVSPTKPRTLPASALSSLNVAKGLHRNN